MSTQTDLLIQMATLALEGRTVLVTGGTGGIGAAICKLFAASGSNVIVTGSNADKLKAFSESLPAGKGKVYTYVCDLRKRADVLGFIQRTVQDCPAIDILINNAGFALNATAPFWEQDLDDVETVMDVNLSGLMAITHAVLKYHMMKRTPQPTGTIINISSITGHQAPPKESFETSYHTSKTGVEGFTNVLRHELVGTNVRVLTHRPGTVHTEFHARRHNYNAESTGATFEGIGALEAEDIAQGILWQCLIPERVSVVMMETLPTSQRSLYVYDREWEARNA